MELRCVSPCVHTYFCPSTKVFPNFDIIWCVGRTRPDTRIHVTLTRSKVKVKVDELLKFRKMHFSRSISSAILARTGSSKLMVDHDTMEPSLQLAKARFLNFLLRQQSHEFKLRQILQEFQSAIFPYCLRLESRGWVCWQSYMYWAC